MNTSVKKHHILFIFLNYDSWLKKTYVYCASAAVIICMYGYLRYTSAHDFSKLTQYKTKAFVNRTSKNISDWNTFTLVHESWCVKEHMLTLVSHNQLGFSNVVNLLSSIALHDKRAL